MLYTSCEMWICLEPTLCADAVGYWFSEIVTDPLYVQLLPGTSAALRMTYTLYSNNV